MRELLRKYKVEIVAISSIKPYPRNARRHTKKQIRKLAALIRTYGWTYPVLVDADGNVIAGHGRLEAAKLLGLEYIPVLRITDLSEQQIAALRLADNRIAEESSWDEDILKSAMHELVSADLDFEITMTGFDMAEIDMVLGEVEPAAAADDIVAADIDGSPVTVPGDLWLLGEHKLLCGDALEDANYKILLGDEMAEMVITDPPYNVPIEGHVSGLGKNKHAEFAMATGEMTPEEFIEFLKDVFSILVAHSIAGSIHAIFMDWRHQAEILAAGRQTYSELKNTCVWAKTTGGMGSLYRSAHEFVYIFKSGTAPHINNVSLGSYGRNRTNVWRYAGINSFGKGRKQALDMHPTVKPVAMIADAILDTSNRKGIVLDPFAGSGTILIAAQRTGRRARAMEIDPGYVDVALRRYRRVTGVEPVLAATSQAFTQIERQRAADSNDPLDTQVTAGGAS